MRIFNWNHETGQRGEEMRQETLASWTAASLEWTVAQGLIAAIPYATPTGFTGNANVAVHIDGGRTTADGDVSYLHPTEWICFCLGEVNAGEDSYWEWIILPPRQLIQKLTTVDADASTPDDAGVEDIAYLDKEQYS